MNTKAVFHSKEPRFEPKNCRIEQVIRLRDEDYADFCSNMLQDRGFLSANRDKMFVEVADGHALWHCLLVVGDTGEDGILVQSGGYDFAWYSAYLPAAKAFLREQVREIADGILAGSSDGSRQISWEELQDRFRYEFTEDDPLAWMLADELRTRACVAGLTCNGGELTFQLSEASASLASDFRTEAEEDPTEFSQQEDESRYRSLTPQEVEVMCAKHVLWLNDDPGGERADFSNCLLKEMNLSRRNLNGAVFTGARFVNTALHHSELCFAECSGAAFFHCDAWDIVAEEADFKDAEFVSCELERGIFTHSNFSRAKFRDCSISCSSMQNCCIDGTEFGDMPLISVNIDGWDFNEQAWLSEPNGIVLSMQ